jgi:hypothetical protein
VCIEQESRHNGYRLSIQLIWGLDFFEYEFEYSPMTAAPPPSIEELRQRVQRMEGTTLTRSLPVLDAFDGLVGLRTGAAYAVDSPSLAMALVAGASRAGEWVAIVGAPDFGYEAAAAFGLDLTRTIAVPSPAEHWQSVTAGLIDVAGVVLLRPPTTVAEQQAARLRSRLVQKDAALVVWGEWPRCHQRLSIRSSSWVGLGQGHGRLTGRQVEVVVSGASAPGRIASIWLPDPDQRVRRLEQVAAPLRLEAQAG